MLARLRSASRSALEQVIRPASRRPEIDATRAELLEGWMVFLAVLAGVPVSLGVVRAAREHEPWFAVVYTLVMGVLIVGLALRKRLHYRTRAWLLLGVMMLWGVASLGRMGFTGMGLTLLVATVVLAVPLLGVRAALGLGLVGLLCITAVGWANARGLFFLASGALTPQQRATAWLNAGVLFALLGAMLPISSQLLLGRLEQALRETEARAAEAHAAKLEASRSEARFRELTELLPQVVFEADLTGRFTYVNRAAYATFGYPESEPLPPDLSVFDVIHPDDCAPVRAVMGRLVAGETGPGLSEYRGRRRDGTLFPVIVNTAAIRRDGAVVGVRGLVIDATERRAAEERLRQSRNLEAVGRLAAGVAHDFNNVLFGIRGRVALMEKAGHPELAEHLSHVDEYVSSAANLTRQLLAFGRGGGYEVAPVNLSDLARKAASMFARTQKRLTVGQALEEKIWTVTADAGQLEQVLLNLLLNADQAIPATGSIDVATRNGTLDEARAAALEMPAGDCVFLEVRDTGVGIEPADVPRIFEPFFTTKGPGRGTGLGLASAYGIVRAHKGAIEVESRRGEGTRFTVVLPATSRETPLVRPPARVAPVKGRETVLVVDDEPLVLSVTKPLLEALGYTALTATSGAEAVAALAREGARISVVLLDMVMPGMSGREAFRKLREIKPGVRVLLVSGFSETAETRELLREPQVGFLGKPYRMEELAKKMRELLDAGAPKPAEASRPA